MLFPVNPHFGPDANLTLYWTTNLPPGVLTL